MVENDEDILQKFFAEYTTEIEDDGFSQRVMQQLPKRQVNLNRIWTFICIVIGIAFFLLSDARQQLRVVFDNLVGDISGVFSSIDFSFVSPIAIYLIFLTFTAVAAYNVLESR